jgi:lipoate---protein ligase
MWILLKQFLPHNKTEPKSIEMKYLDIVFADPARNLACDEALIDFCEADAGGTEILRIWEPANYFVVLGYSNRVAREIDVDTCEASAIPILRRSSGGGAVLQGPGCVNYTLIMRNERPGYVGDIGKAYRRVLEPHRRIFTTLTSEAVEIEGISDLTIVGRKFSGNSQHRKRSCTLFHGTFLLGLDFSLVETCLRMPSRQPSYRQDRPHGLFLRNIPIDATQVRRALREEWQANERLLDFPYQRLEDLVRNRYSCSDWNRKY